MCLSCTKEKMNIPSYTPGIKGLTDFFGKCLFFFKTQPSIKPFLAWSEYHLQNIQHGYLTFQQEDKKKKGGQCRNSKKKKTQNEISRLFISFLFSNSKRIDHALAGVYLWVCRVFMPNGEREIL